MRKGLYMFVVSCLLLIATACGSQSDNNQGANNANNAANQAQNESPAEGDSVAAHDEAIAIYEQNCIQCHAADLSGNTGPQSNIQKVGAKLSKEEIADTIKNGGKIMPAQTQLSDEEVELLAEWLATKK